MLAKSAILALLSGTALVEATSNKLSSEAVVPTLPSDELEEVDDV